MLSIVCTVAWSRQTSVARLSGSRARGARGLRVASAREREGDGGAHGSDRTERAVAKDG